MWCTKLFNIVWNLNPIIAKCGFREACVTQRSVYSNMENRGAMYVRQKFYFHISDNTVLCRSVKEMGTVFTICCLRQTHPKTLNYCYRCLNTFIIYVHFSHFSLQCTRTLTKKTASSQFLCYLLHYIHAIIFFLKRDAMSAKKKIISKVQ